MTKRKQLTRSATLVCLVLSGLLTGCAAIPLGVLGAATGAARAAPGAFSAGELRTAEMVGFEQMTNAIYLAIDELALEIRDDQLWDDGRRRRIIVWDENAVSTHITIRRQTEKMTALAIDVGLFGPKPTAELIYERVEIQLAQQ